MVSYAGLVLLALLPLGCAHYSTQGGLVGGIRSVAVPVAENRTSEAGIAELLSARLADAFSADGRLRVFDEERADGLLLLRITQVEDRPFTFTAAEETQQYRFQLRVGADLERVEDGGALLNLEDIAGWGTYDAGQADDEGREAAVEAALDMVIAEVLDRVTASW
jgi:hypothetical protein